MACDCEASAPSTPGTTGCCSIASNVPNGIPVRLEYHNAAGGAASGAEVTIYRAESGTTDPTIPQSSQTLWLYWIQVVVEDSQDVNLYFGSSVSADSNPNTTIVRGNFQANGGIVASLPLVPLSTGSRVYVKSPATGQLDVVGYGVLA